MVRKWREWLRTLVASFRPGPGYQVDPPVNEEVCGICGHMFDRGMCSWVRNYDQLSTGARRDLGYHARSSDHAAEGARRRADR